MFFTQQWCHFGTNGVDSFLVYMIFRVYIIDDYIHDLRNRKELVMINRALSIGIFDEREESFADALLCRVIDISFPEQINKKLQYFSLYLYYFRKFTSSLSLESTREFFISINRSTVSSSTIFQVISASSCPTILKKLVLAASNYERIKRVSCWLMISIIST